MQPISRRNFLQNGAFGLTAVAMGAGRGFDLFGQPLGIPIGLELWTVRRELEEDFVGTLKKVAAIGYKSVEMFSFYDRRASEIRRILGDIGLTCPSAHYVTPMMKSGWEKHIEYAGEVGIQYMVCAILDPSERRSLDDYRKLADLFNKVGEQCKKAGIQFAYHNHNFEFKSYGGVLGYDELLRRTDPDLMKLQMDCFWVTHAGRDPVAYFRRLGERIHLLHIKDLKAGNPPTTTMDPRVGLFAEVGRGEINWTRIFNAARNTGVKHYYVEQDECERPPLESIKISYDYLENLKL